MNSRWEKICKFAMDRQTKLQSALLKCKDLTLTVEELLRWAQSIETSILQAEPVDVSADRETMTAKRNQFQVRVQRHF